MSHKTRLEPVILARTEGGYPAEFPASYFESALPSRDREEPTPEELAKEVKSVERVVRRHWDLNRSEADEMAVLIHHALTNGSEVFSQEDAERYGLKEIPHAGRVKRDLRITLAQSIPEQPLPSLL